MKPLTILKELGYSEHEAVIYLALLKMGEGSVTDIAKQTQFPRTTVNEVLEAMSHKGYVNFYSKKKRRVWVSESPERISTTLREKQSLFESALPALKSMAKDSVEKPHVHVYTGVGEIKAVMDEVLASKHNILAILDWDEWIDLFGADYVNNFIERRIKANLRIHLISPRTNTATQLKNSDNSELRHTRFLPPETRLHTSNFLFGNKTALISLNRRLPVAVMIEDEGISQTMHILFQSLWSSAIE